MMIRALTAAAAFALAACGDLDASLEEAKQGAATIGQDVLEAGLGAVDTRTACVLAGQSEAFCTCASERLGPNITGEHVDAFRTAIAATINGEPLDAADADGEAIDPATREAIVQCATTAAIQGAVNEAGN